MVYGTASGTKSITVNFTYSYNYSENLADCVFHYVNGNITTVEHVYLDNTSICLNLWRIINGDCIL